MFSIALGAFVMAFSSLLPVINPFNGAMFFVTLTQNLSEKDRVYIVNRIALFSFFLLLVSLFAGHFILSFFGISVGVLRVAGGIVLFAAGWHALNAPTQEEKYSGEIEEKSLTRARLKSMAFYPFTLPLTTGPGAISVAVALGTSMPYDLPNLIGILLATIATIATTWICYRYSTKLSKAVGSAGADALARVFAFILICLGVSVFWQGFAELWVSMPK